MSVFSFPNHLFCLYIFLCTSLSRSWLASCTFSDWCAFSNWPICLSPFSDCLSASLLLCWSPITFWDRFPLFFLLPFHLSLSLSPLPVIDSFFFTVLWLTSIWTNTQIHTHGQSTTINLHPPAHTHTHTRFHTELSLHIVSNSYITL